MSRILVPAILLSCLLPLPALNAQDLPSPESVIGFKPGADFKLADWPMMERYFRALDQASNRVDVEVIGKSTMGKDMLLVTVSSEENLAGKAEIMASYRRLADPRGLSPEEAGNLIQGLPMALFVGCAQHASEIASTQMVLELAYRLAAEETPEMERIRNNVVFRVDLS